jgi:uncharacterized membrane protein YgcG
MDPFKAPVPRDLIFDPLGTLDRESAALTAATIQRLREKTQSEVCVAVIETTGGEPPQDYGVRLYNHWRLGQSGRNNGVLVLFAIKDRRVELIPGKGYKGLFNKATCETLVKTHIVPLMRAGKMAEGISSCANRVVQRIEDHERPDAASGAIHLVGEDEQEFVETSGRRPSVLPAVICLSFLVATGGLFIASFIFGVGLLSQTALYAVLGAGAFIATVFLVGHVRPILSLFTIGVAAIAMLGVEHICPKCNRWLSIEKQILRPATAAAAGKGKRIERCARCEFRSEAMYDIPIPSSGSDGYDSGGSDSGGFDSGGSSDGGGGGADW